MGLTRMRGEKIKLPGAKSVRENFARSHPAFPTSERRFEIKEREDPTRRSSERSRGSAVFGSYSLTETAARLNSFCLTA